MAGTLKVKIQEDIILDNQDYGSKRVFEISSIANITKKIVSIRSCKYCFHSKKSC